MDDERLKLKLPPWHIPYLEKHRIMELFHELARELVIQQPVDHLMFIKQILNRAANSVGISRVIILNSPKVNTTEVARQIAQQTNHHVITEDMLFRSCGVSSRADLKPGALAICLSYMLHMEEPQNNGWILVDCIKTAKEAAKILQTGIIPTHVLHLIPPFSPDLNTLLYCNVHAYWPAYRREIMAIRELFKTKLVEIFLRQRFIHEVVKECVEVIKVVKGLGCPKQIRCVIIGPRGAGRRTQAKLLVQKLNLVHIDFPRLLCQAWNAQNEFGDTLRAQKDDVCFRSDLMTQLLNKRVLEEDCVKQGWVMTGFPFSVTDFKYLDTLDTPPNRVIFLECDLNICRERVVNRRIDVYSGSLVDIIKSPEMVALKRLETHPKDKVGIVNAELNYYCEQYGALRNYCGETAHVINSDQPERWVFECIISALAKGNLSAAPRNPCLDEDLTGSSSSTSELDPTTTKMSEPTQATSYFQDKIKVDK